MLRHVCSALLLSSVCLAACTPGGRPRAMGDEPDAEAPPGNAPDGHQDRARPTGDVDAAVPDMLVAPPDAAADDRADGAIVGDATAGPRDGAGRADTNFPSDARPADAAGDARPGDAVVAANVAPIVAWRLEIPCTTRVADAPHVCVGKQSYKTTKTFGGNPAKTYEVTIRIRGIVEEHLYLGANGTLMKTVTPAPYFAANVNPVVPTAQLPPRGAENPIKPVYKLEVPEPAGNYYLNVYHTLGWPTLIHKIDYTGKIKVQGGALLTLSYSDGNNMFYRNVNDFTVAGLAPHPKPYDGQVVQLDTVTIVEVP